MGNKKAWVLAIGSLCALSVCAADLPNAHFVMSEDLVRLAAELQPVKNRQFNTQSLQGGIVSGWVDTTGNSSIDIIPDRNHASYLIKVQGTTSAPDQTFQRGRFTVYSSMQAPFVATKRLYFEGNKVKSDPAQAWVNARIVINSASAPRRMGANIAYRRATKSAPASAQDSAGQIQKQVTETLDKQVKDAMEENSGQGPLSSVGNGNLPPSRATIRSESTDQYAIFRAAEPGRGKVTTETAVPPRLKQGGDLLVQTHESSANNYLENWLAGTEETDLRLFRTYKLLMNDEPYDLRPHDRTEKWGFLYAKKDPVTFWFRKGLVEIRVRGSEIRRTPVGETLPIVLFRSFAARAFMEPVIRDGKIVLVRRTVAQVVFTDKEKDDPASEEWRGFLLKKFNALFSEEWTFDGLEIPDGSTFEKFGALTPFQVSCDEEWLTLGWTLKK